MFFFHSGLVLKKTAKPPMSPQDFFDAVVLQDWVGVQAGIAQGLDVNSVDGEGNTALHRAVDNGNAEMVQLLLAQPNINVNVQNHLKTTPLMAAVQLQNIECVRLLVQAGADVNLKNNGGYTALMMNYPVDNSSADIYSLLLNVKDIDVQSVLHGWNALLWMLDRNYAKDPLLRVCIKKLVDLGADVNFVGEDGSYPFLFCDYELFKYLRKAGARMPTASIGQAMMLDLLSLWYMQQPWSEVWVPQAVVSLKNWMGREGQPLQKCYFEDFEDFGVLWRAFQELAPSFQALGPSYQKARYEKMVELLWQKKNEYLQQFYQADVLRQHRSGAHFVGVCRGSGFNLLLEALQFFNFLAPMPGSLDCHIQEALFLGFANNSLRIKQENAPKAYRQVPEPESSVTSSIALLSPPSATLLIASTAIKRARTDQEERTPPQRFKPSPL